MNQDDENWFDALAGKPNPDANPATLIEASALRAALLAQSPNTSQDRQKIVQINSVQLLRERLRAEGLIPATEQKSKVRRTLVATIAASFLVCTGITLTVQKRQESMGPEILNTETYRGGEDSVPIFAEDPRIAAQHLEQKLSALNIQSQVQCELDHCTIEAYIPNSQEEAVNILLKSDKKTVGANGQLLLQFSSQGRK